MNRKKQHFAARWFRKGLFLLLFPLSIPVGTASAVASGKLIRWNIYGREETIGVITRMGFPIWYFHFGSTLPDGMVYPAWREGLNTVFWTIVWLALFFSKLLWRTPATNPREEPK